MEILILYHNGNSTNPILGCYSSIISQSNVESTDNFYKYMEKYKSRNPTLATTYFTALGRERYSMYKTNHDPVKLKAEFIVP